MKRFLLVLFIITLAISVILIGPGCKGIIKSSTQLVTVKDKIAFVSTRNGNAGIYIMNTDGTEQARLTNDPIGDHELCFSP
jgi:hypothetical protein